MSDLSARQRLDTPRTSRSRFSLNVDAEAVGRFSESIARFLGTGRFLLWQSIVVIVWISLNLFAVKLRWDPYPFILLNLAFSTQAAYAAPLILLAQTRQADRDKATADDLARIADAQRRHVEQQSAGLRELVRANTALTERVAAAIAEMRPAARAVPQDVDAVTPASPPRPAPGA
jgi:uncharacterized membrane protein